MTHPIEEEMQKAIVEAFRLGTFMKRNGITTLGPIELRNSSVAESIKREAMAELMRLSEFQDFSQ